VSRDEGEAAVAEVRKTRDTASRLANGEYPEDADHIRVLAGLIQQLADQVERLAVGSSGAPEPGLTPVSRGDTAPGMSGEEDEVIQEEDQPPVEDPAEPLRSA
jgi:hypothetical protein